MKNNKTTILVFVLLVVAAALYRVWDGRPLGFAPQIAMALFAGSVIKDKRFSFLVPLFSMLVSDVLYQVLYMQGLTEIKGFMKASGQIIFCLLPSRSLGFSSIKIKSALLFWELWQEYFSFI